MRKALLTILALGPICGLHAATGVAPYLPLQLEPEMERQIERLLILADRPVLARPFSASQVLEALPAACARDAILCRSVARFLARYTAPGALAHMSVEAAAADGSGRAVPNRHGLRDDGAWFAAGQVYLQPNPFVLLSAGGVAHEDEAVPAGSLLSVGFEFAQLDLGYRAHWFSPLTDSSMLLGTEAPTAPSITLSGPMPLTRFGVRYEAFLARLSRSDRIASAGGFTSGSPRLAGLHLSIAPVPGWSLGVNRILQYGGGTRPDSFGDLLEAFLDPAGVDNAPAGAPDAQFGNQLASVTSRLVIPAATPFALYVEYAGEDTSRGRSYLLGNSALSAGIDFPQLWRSFDLTYEVAEWQNAWYVNGIYGDGLTNEGRVLGHWGGDQRLPGDAVGARSHMLRLGWNPAFGGTFDLRYRSLENESYSAVHYRAAHDFTLRYSRTLRGFLVGAELRAGRDVLGEDFSRVAAFLRYAPAPPGFGAMLDAEPQPVRGSGSELFVHLGLSGYDLEADLEADTPLVTESGTSPHLAVGARRAVSARGDLGVRLELDEIGDDLLLAVRALDYRHRFARPFAIGAFLGAARYDLDTPAYGLYAGAGLEWRPRAPWGVSLEVRRAFDVARDDLLPTDPQGGRPDSFYDITAATLSLSRRF